MPRAWSCERLRPGAPGIASRLRLVARPSVHVISMSPEALQVVSKARGQRSAARQSRRCPSVHGNAQHMHVQASANPHAPASPADHGINGRSRTDGQEQIETTRSNGSAADGADRRQGGGGRMFGLQNTGPGLSPLFCAREFRGVGVKSCPCLPSLSTTVHHERTP